MEKLQLSSEKIVCAFALVLMRGYKLIACKLKNVFFYLNLAINRTRSGNKKCNQSLVHLITLSFTLITDYIKRIILLISSGVQSLIAT